MYTGSSSYSFDWGGGKKRKRPDFPFLLHQPSKMETLHENMLGRFRYFLPAPLTKLLSPLADMLSWAVWFKFLPNKVIANTCLFFLTSSSKQSASWKVLEICELCALSTDSPKTSSVNKYMYTGSSSYSFDWGGRNGKDPISLFCGISLPKWKDYMKRCWVFSVNSSEPHWQNYYPPPSWYAQLSSMVQVSA